MSYGEDYLIALRCIDTLQFPVGRKLLADILRGDEKNPSIKRNNLQRNEYFGSLAYTPHELNGLIEWMERKKIINYVSVRGKRFVKVITLSAKGLTEMSKPTLHKEKPAIEVPVTIITAEDKARFVSFGPFLSTYNDEQKKAIISPSSNILCIAGAGSGKTTVLTKRIEFLTRYCSVDASSILAITFTRKARQEMQRRLEESQVAGVHIHTFNSFCEQLLRKHAEVMYDRPVRVMTYGDKQRLVRKSLEKHNLSPARAVYIYFTPGQRRSKTHDRLFAIFVNDLFFILDYYKSQGTDVQDFSSGVKDQTMAQIVYRICKYLEVAKKKHGLRDFMDQLVDGLALIRQHTGTMPKYSHILIDEYQDVNDLQMELIQTLRAENIFVVGDPRQAIYGWRGSRVQHILDRIKTAEVINLTTNYRSLPRIVDMMNKGIAHMKMPDLKSSREGEAKLRLISVGSQKLEHELVVQKIIELRVPRDEIFVLARTNRQLNELSQLLRHRRIEHIVRSDEVRRPAATVPGSVTLATVHAIKGLEAKVVFVMGCSSSNFPCKASEHPVIDLIKLDTYDSEEEERRLFYVAISRAKDELYLTYSTTRRTPYITEEMSKMIQTTSVTSSKLITRLKEWRNQTAEIMNVPRYCVLQDATLEAVAQAKPTTEQELLAIKGFGPTTVHKYGDAILKMLSGR